MIKLDHIHTLVLQNSIAICIYIYGVYHEVDFGLQVKEMIITPTLHRNYHMQQKNMIILKQPFILHSCPLWFAKAPFIYISRCRCLSSRKPCLSSCQRPLSLIRIEPETVGYVCARSCTSTRKMVCE